MIHAPAQFRNEDSRWPRRQFECCNFRGSVRVFKKTFPPLLILHGDADQVIPVENGRQLETLAKKLGAPVDLVIYPGEMHGFGADFAKKSAQDALAKTIAFLHKQLAAN